MTWYPDTLRRLGLGAVLTFVSSAVVACGETDNDVGGPSEPEPPVDQGQAATAGCSDGVLQEGALYRVCFPETWNGDLVLYAHGYVAPQRELALPQEVVGTQSLADLITGLGYAYATTSYRANGLIAPEAVEDLNQLVDTIEARYRPDPARTVIVGFSEGGLVATLATERHPNRFDGALAGCGPIGDFRAQLDYMGDFRVVFDYFFPGLLPGSAANIPDVVRERWDDVYVPAIVVALAARPEAAQELLFVTGAPAAGNDLPSVAETTVGLLWYNVFGTADAQVRLGGQPLDNSDRVYRGSSNDAALNAQVERFIADAEALAGLERFRTSGLLRVPVINLHTTGDPIVPFGQAALYQSKVTTAGTADWFTQIDVDRSGHCTFESGELLSAFAALWDRIDTHTARSSSAVALR